MSLSNLTPTPQLAVFSLKNNQQIVINLPDKGGNIVAMDSIQCERMVMESLNNCEWYKGISEIYVDQLTNKYRNVITKAFLKGIIDRKHWSS